MLRRRRTKRRARRRRSETEWLHTRGAFSKLLGEVLFQLGSDFGRDRCRQVALKPRKVVAVPDGVRVKLANRDEVKVGKVPSREGELEVGDGIVKHALKAALGARRFKLVGCAIFVDVQVYTAERSAGGRDEKVRVGAVFETQGRKLLLGSGDGCWLTARHRDVEY